MHEKVWKRMDNVPPITWLIAVYNLPQERKEVAQRKRKRKMFLHPRKNIEGKHIKNTIYYIKFTSKKVFSNGNQDVYNPPAGILAVWYVDGKGVSH